LFRFTKKNGTTKFKGKKGDDMKNTVSFGKLMTSRAYLYKCLTEAIPGRFGIHFTGLIEDFSGFEVRHLNASEMSWREKMISYLSHRNRHGKEDPRVKLANVIMEMAGIILLKMVSTKIEDFPLEETLKQLNFDDDHPGLTFELSERDQSLAGSLVNDPFVVVALQNIAFQNKVKKLVVKYSI
jgi:hypothetical protein